MKFNSYYRYNKIDELNLDVFEPINDCKMGVGKYFDFLTKKCEDFINFE